jgi:acetyl-CoA synthetase
MPDLRTLQAEALADPDAFWAREAADLPWFTPWDTVLDWTPPTYTWFAGATTNLTYACLDRHVQAGRGERPALIWRREDGARRVLTYADLLAEVERVSAALRAAGIGAGDRITLSLPVSIEAIALMLACARIGAIHSVVFAGFGAGALGQRIRLSGSKMVVVADTTQRRGGEVPLKPILDEALAEGDHDVERVIVVRRAAHPAPPRRRLRRGARHAPGLHPRHQRHHRDPEARRARPRRLHGGSRRDGPLGLRPR